jgi:hypothetical protein
MSVLDVAARLHPWSWTPPRHVDVRPVLRDVVAPRAAMSAVRASGRRLRRSTARLCTAPMKHLRTTLFAAGLLMQIAGTFFENPDPASWHGRKVAYRFAPAVDGYRKLLTASASLSASDRGFGEWLEISTASAPHISKDQVSVIHLSGLDVTPSGNGTYLELRNSEGRALHSTSILNPMAEIEKRFYDQPLRQARSVLFWVGLALSAVMYILEVRERAMQSS